MEGTGNGTVQGRVEAVRYGDNFAYLLSDPAGAACVVIDAGDAAAVLRALDRRRLRPVLLLATHGHRDHTAGANAVARVEGSRVSPRGVEGEGSRVSPHIVATL